MRGGYSDCHGRLSVQKPGLVIQIGPDGQPLDSPDSHLQTWISMCPNASCVPGSMALDTHWRWEAGCSPSNANPQFQSPAFTPPFSGVFELWASFQPDLAGHQPNDPPDKLGIGAAGAAQINLNVVQPGKPIVDPTRIPFVETCGPGNSTVCPDPTESRWKFDPSAAMKEAFSASLRVKEIRVFDQPGDPSQSVRFCWAEASGTVGTHSNSDCDASNPNQVDGCKATANGIATPGTPFGTVGTSGLPSPWTIGFSDDSSGKCPIPTLSKIWVEFTLELAPPRIVSSRPPGRVATIATSKRTRTYDECTQTPCTASRR